MLQVSIVVGALAATIAGVGAVYLVTSPEERTPPTSRSTASPAPESGDPPAAAPIRFEPKPLWRSGEIMRRVDDAWIRGDAVILSGSRLASTSAGRTTSSSSIWALMAAGEDTALVSVAEAHAIITGGYPTAWRNIAAVAIDTRTGERRWRRTGWWPQAGNIFLSDGRLWSIDRRGDVLVRRLPGRFRAASDRYALFQRGEHGGGSYTHHRVR